MKTLTFCLALIVMSCTLALGQATEKVLWSFGSVPNDGNRPTGSLISDSAGNLYGTTQGGGVNGYGTIFELSVQSEGTWAESILYNFCSDLVGLACLDGAGPTGALTFDSAGNLFGTTQGGGSSLTCGTLGSACGTAFELSPSSGGSWTESVLYNFCSLPNCTDGSLPTGTLTSDSSGNLYGTTIQGGSKGSGKSMGTVFKITNTVSGWTENVLYSFCAHGNGKFCPDGSFPRAGVTFDSHGNLFGTTQSGGGNQHNAEGIVYELSPGSGTWTEKILIDLYPGSSSAPVSFDAAGNLYGTTVGTAFQLNAHRQTSRSRPFDQGIDSQSTAGVLIDAAHNALFGTTSLGGANSGGQVWEVTSSPSRPLVSVYDFCARSNCSDGFKPSGGVIEDSLGNLYGMTERGGANGQGVVFELTP